MKLDDLPKAYDPKEHEEKIYRIWEDSGFFNPDNLPDATAREPYVIMLPLPNITGVLHMGHALNSTMQDILIRRRRMQGYRTLWLPGTDHAGIAAQNAVEKALKKEGLTRHDLGKEKFLKRVWEWKEKYGGIILSQLKQIGSSCDWSRARFTMDEDYKKEVRNAFLHYYEKGWIYKGKRTINWCARCATGISDLEVEHKEEQGKLYYIKYGPITIATVRPETKLGDTALAVNPDDERYKKYVGAKISIESTDPSIPKEMPPQAITVDLPVVEDAAADPEFGSGVIKVTPAHDITDFEISLRHPEIQTVKIIGENGRIADSAGIRYSGMKIKEARDKIVKDLDELGLLVRIEDYSHNLSICSRCGTVLEPLLSDQWFLKMGELARMARKPVESGEITFYPKRWEKLYFDWLGSSRDWCISRQLWWGHEIPIEGEDSVLDTWFSSALWPFAALRGGDRKIYFPGTVNVTARDIINLWVGRMIFSSVEFMGDIPFKDVIIHATILAKDGRRMSKSLGTGVNPMDYINEFGADAARFGLIWQSMGGQDIHWAEEHVRAGKKFLNKLWNSGRFILGRVGEGGMHPKRPEATKEHTKNILKLLDKTSSEVNSLVDSYEFGRALRTLYDFYWHTFCDIFLEEAKNDLSEETDQTLLFVLVSSLKMLHPFIPFVTEYMWGLLPIKDKKLLLIEKI